MESECSVEGTCLLMCPANEISMREREDLLHPFEMSKECFSLGSQLSRCTKKADKSRAVKKFSRPAAGKADVDLSELRPAPVLKDTVEYLFQEIIPRSETPWPGIYYFVFDRLRAVRQDLVIQSIAGRDAITILEQIVRFHTYASYRLKDCDIADFDPLINKQHMLECLKRLLYLYQITEGSHKNQVEFESVYLLDSLGDLQAISHFLEIPNHLRKEPMLRTCFDINMAFLLKNYARALHLISQLPSAMCLCAVNPHLFNLKINYLLILSHGYSAKNCKFPVSKLAQLLHTASHQTVFELCASCGLIDMFTQESDQHICFSKSNFQRPQKEQPPSELPQLEELLSKCHLSGLLLCTESSKLNCVKSDDKHSHERMGNSVGKGANRKLENKKDYHGVMKGVSPQVKGGSGKGRGRGQRSAQSVQEMPKKNNIIEGHHCETITNPKEGIANDQEISFSQTSKHSDMLNKENDSSLTVRVNKHKNDGGQFCETNETSTCIDNTANNSDSYGGMKGVCSQLDTGRGSGRGRGRGKKARGKDSKIGKQT